jgi:hypothetical protein
MEQKDYLMRQIEQLGQVLARMLARLLNIKEATPGGLTIEEIKRIYGDELDLTLDLILETPAEKLVEVLNSRVKFMDHHLEKMAGILTETADIYETSGEPETARDLLGKSIRIYEYMQETSGAYSLDRVMKITKLNRRLQLRR